MKQTAVEWLIEKLTPSIALRQKYINELKEQAKEMEKQQSYSEEEMLQALNIGFTSTDETWEECVEFAKEQFKKK